MQSSQNGVKRLDIAAALWDELSSEASCCDHDSGKGRVYFQIILIAIASFQQFQVGPKLSPFRENYNPMAMDSSQSKNMDRDPLWVYNPALIS